MGDWKWKVSCYYGDKAKRPKVPGALAIETVHKDDVSKDIEVEVAEGRKDIGKIIVTRIPRR